MRRFVGCVLCGGILCVGGWSLTEFIGHAPAFQKSLQTEGVYGDWRVSPGRVMYHQGDYLFQLSTGFLHADSLVSETTGAADAIADSNTAISRAERARALVESAVAAAPANAYYWNNAAWAAAIAGDVAGARAAMTTSHLLAPRSLELAYSRLSFSAILAAEMSAAGGTMTDEEIADLRRDFSTLKALDTDATAFILDDPRLAGYLE